MTNNVSIEQMAVGVVPAFPRQFYLYVDRPGPAFDQLVEILEARGIAERHMTTGAQIIGARTSVEDIRISVPFGERPWPQLIDNLADAFRDLAIRGDLGVRVYLRTEHETKKEGGVVLAPGADIDADHAALRRLLNEAAAAAGLLARAGD
ncbi:hypothetical protein [Krasilnikovia sp. MM14-A1259]|uniref:hypothetical protein n=1 Tax=Krasilnikovia sp. MM14-A1259 TaxID=3373539 RepID=UPI0037FEE700